MKMVRFKEICFFSVLLNDQVRAIRDWLKKWVIIIYRFKYEYQLRFIVLKMNNQANDQSRIELSQ